MSFPCEYCHKSFTIACLLRKHTRVFHPEIKRNVLQKNKQDVGKMPRRYVIIKWSNPGYSRSVQHRSFICDVCTASFQSNDLLRNHQRKCRKSSKSRLCRNEGISDSRVTSKSRGRESVIWRERRELVQCIHCVKQFSSSRTLDRHVKSCHQSEDGNKSSVKKSNASLHCASSSAYIDPEDEDKSKVLENCVASFQCEKCERQFPSSRGLRCHIRVCHVDEKLTDDSPRKTTKSRARKKLIVKTKKQRLRRSSTSTSCICEKCGKVFASAVLLRKHNRTCCIEADISVITSRLRPLMPKLSEAPYDGISSDNDTVLESKSVIYGSADGYKQGVTIGSEFDTCEDFIPSSAAMYQCDHCKKYFTSKLTLSNHMKVFHQTVSATSYTQQQLNPHPASSRVRGTVNKKLQCYCCKAKFSVYSKLSEHFRLSHPGVGLCEDYSEIQGTESEARPPLLQWTDIDKRDALECPYCHRHLLKNSSLRRHVKKIHPGADLPQCRTRGRKLSMEEAQQRQIVNCTDCHKFFYSKRGLRLHRKKVHGASSESKSRFIFSMANMYGQGDLTDAEGVPTFRDLQFESLLEFQQWKAEEEANSIARFNKVRRDQRNGDGSIRRTYVCHRSGTYVPQGHGMRRIKLQGSAKIGTRCPSSIYLKYFPNGKAMARYFPTHEGHECDPVYLLKKRERKNRGIKISAESVSRRQPKPRVIVKKSKEIAEEHVMAIQSALEGCPADVMKSICDQLSQIRALMSTTTPTTTVVSQPNSTDVATTMQATTMHDIIPQLQLLQADVDPRNNIQQYFFPNVSEEVLSFISL